METKTRKHDAMCLKNLGWITQFDLNCTRCNEDSYKAVTALRPEAEKYLHYFGKDTPLKYELDRTVAGKLRYVCGYCGHETKTVNGQLLHTKRMIRRENGASND